MTNEAAQDRANGGEGNVVSFSVATTRTAVSRENHKNTYTCTNVQSHAPATHSTELFVDLLVDGQSLDQCPRDIDEWGRTGLHQPVHACNQSTSIQQLRHKNQESSNSAAEPAPREHTWLASGKTGLWGQEGAKGAPARDHQQARL